MVIKRSFHSTNEMKWTHMHKPRSWIVCLDAKNHETSRRHRPSIHQPERLIHMWTFTCTICVAKKSSLEKNLPWAFCALLGIGWGPFFTVGSSLYVHTERHISLSMVQSVSVWHAFEGSSSGAWLERLASPSSIRIPQLPWKYFPNEAFFQFPPPFAPRYPYPIIIAWYPWMCHGCCCTSA